MKALKVLSEGALGHPRAVDGDGATELAVLLKAYKKGGQDLTCTA